MIALRSLALAALLALAPLSASAQYATLDGSNAYLGQSVIMSAGSRAAAVRKLKAVPSVGVINLDVRRVPRFRDDNMPDPAEYRISAQKNAAGVRKLRQALSANPVTRKALERRGIAISRVVGVQISSNGSLRVYLL